MSTIEENDKYKCHFYTNNSGCTNRALLLEYDPNFSLKEHKALQKANKSGYFKYQSIQNIRTAKLSELQVAADNGNYIAQHKYDGQNTQIIFKKNLEPLYASRNVVFGNSLPEITSLEYVVKIMRNVQQYLDEHIDLQKINLFGEKYGSKCINRIQYNNTGDNTTNIIFFDVFFDDVIQSPKKFYEFAANMEMGDHVVEILKGPDSLKVMLEMDIGLSTIQQHHCVVDHCVVDENLIEGVVIKKYDYNTTNGVYKFLKRVNLKYMESEYVERTNNHEQKSEPLVLEDKFFHFINRSHVISGYSKSIWTISQVYQLYNIIIEDTLCEYEQIHDDIPKISKQTKRKVMALILDVMKNRC